MIKYYRLPHWRTKPCFNYSFVLSQESVPDGSNTMKLIKDAKKVLAVPGYYLDVFTALMFTFLFIRIANFKSG